MPQIILAIIAIIIGAWVVAAIVWIVQWIAAYVVLIWQVFIMPFFIYLTPAVLISVVIAAIFWGSWIAIQNYFLSLKTNINPVGLIEEFTKYYVISALTLFLGIIYLSFIVSYLMLIYQSGELFFVHVINHYESITFPAFRIHFPFWEN